MKNGNLSHQVLVACETSGQITQRLAQMGIDAVAKTWGEFFLASTRSD